MSLRIQCLLLIVLLIFFSACAPKYSRYISNYKFQGSEKPDYSSLDYWAAHPDKRDPSDSLPAPLKKDYRKDSTVDVFFLHPTTLTSKKNMADNADINDAEINAKTDYTTILYQASAFNEYRVFAPRYRQAHYRTYFNPDTAAGAKNFNLAYEDVKASFQYYLDHYNRGRPIIIAAHSQGTTHGKRLMKDFFENNPSLKKQLVAAYLVGMYIPKDYYTELKVCTDSLQTGCVCAWRTYKTNYVPSYIEREKGTGMVTNPVTWKIEKEYVPKEWNKGVVTTNFKKLYYNVSDAQISDKGVLWISKPDFPGSVFMRTKNYHIGDINLFYMNIRENLRQRVAAFYKK